MKLIALLALPGAVVAGVFFSWRNRKSLSSTWTSAKDSTSEWADTASQFADELKDTIADQTESAVQPS